MRSEQGLSVAELAQLGDHQWVNPPKGFIDVGRLLSEPGDIGLNPERLDEVEDIARRASIERQMHGEQSISPAPVEEVLKDIFGAKYRPRMKPTPLIRRLSRMKSEYVQHDGAEPSRPRGYIRPLCPAASCSDLKACAFDPCAGLCASPPGPVSREGAAYGHAVSLQARAAPGAGARPGSATRGHVRPARRALGWRR